MTTVFRRIKIAQNPSSQFLSCGSLCQATDIEQDIEGWLLSEGSNRGVAAADSNGRRL
jgi:hypothetical protein